jgi:hypothetical protein
MDNKVYNIIYTLLYGDSAVRAIVADRIYPNVAPQTMKSLQQYLVYHVAGTKAERSFVNSTISYKVGVGAYATSYEKVNDLIEAIKTKLERYRGDVNGTFVNSIFYEEEGDRLIEAPQLHHRQAMFIVNIGFKIG